MSTVFPEECKCSICGTTNEYSVLGSTNTFGGPDLDLRPSEMQRSTMYLWVQECPNCGYVSSEVSDPSSVTKEWLAGEKYSSCDGIEFSADLAKRFYKQYLINLEDKNSEDAFFAVLHAAWACDDENDEDNAKHCRELAIPLVQELIQKGHENKDSLELLKADLMRRTGRFDELIAQYSSLRFEDDLLDQIMAFQINKAKEKDVACYRVEDVTGE